MNIASSRRHAARAAPWLAVAAACVFVAAPPSHGGVAPGPVGLHPPPPGHSPWLCPLLASPEMSLNGSCVAAPRSIAVAKDPQHGGGAPAAGAAQRQSANPSIMVIDLGPAFSTTLANWARAGGPPGTVVISIFDGHHFLLHSTTLHNARPVSLTSSNQLTLSYAN
jgi:hypothetical protein